MSKLKKLFNSQNKNAAPMQYAVPHFEDKMLYNNQEYYLKYSYNDVQIVGSEYCGSVRLIPFETLGVYQEPNNQVDKDAVVVTVVRNGQTVKVGYLSSGSRLQRMVNDYYRQGGIICAFVDNHEDYKMSMAFYKVNKFKQCPNCGFNNPIEGSFCSRCGTKL